MATDQNQRNIYLLAVALLIAAGALYFIKFYQPFTQQYQTLANEISVISADLAAVQEASAQWQQVHINYPELAGTLGELNVLLPQEKEVAVLISGLEQVMLANELTGVRIIPEGGGKPPPGETGEQLDLQQYRFTVNFTGSYADILAALAGIEQMPRLVTVNTLYLTPSEGGGQAGQFQLDGTIQISAYSME